MTISSSFRVLLASVGVATVALTASGAACAQNNNVYWSVGMSAPGMQVGVANVPPVAVYPQMAYPQVIYPPMYAVPHPVGYYAPPAPVYYAPPVWQPRFAYGHHAGYGYGHRMQERFEHGHGGWGGWGGHGGHGGGSRH